jgi:PAS domain S-box-containing protein
MPPHGHYCVPIITDDELLGVLNLYVKHGHDKTPQEEAFLSAVANVLAGTIKRRRAEESLRESEERFDLAVRGTDAGIWDWNLVTNEVFYSPRWKSMLGYDEDEIRNDYVEWEARLHPDDRERALTTVQEYLEAKTPDYELEHRLRHKDGSYRWILARGAIVRDEHGKPYRMVGSHLDVTDRKRSQQALREREGQLIAAQRIQEHILPRVSPVVPGFDIAGGLIAAEFAAGDYFDYLCLPDGSLAIVVGDVSGHGFGAALLMASTAAHLRSFAEEHSDLEEIVKHTNALLNHEVEEDRFVTLLFARIGLSSGTIEYVNAGHPSGYVLDPSGDVKAVLESSTLPLAILPDGDFPVSNPIQLKPDDLIVLVTDGVLEACSSDDRVFGNQRMLETVRANRHLKAEEIIESLHRAVSEFTGGGTLQDDVTVVVMKVEASAKSAQV